MLPLEHTAFAAGGMGDTITLKETAALYLLHVSHATGCVTMFLTNKMR
jgi:hypothetical protein